MKPASVLISGILIGSPLLSGQLLAAEWQKQAGIAVGTYYSDNICRTEDETINRGAATVTPDISLRGEGARANLFLDAAVEYNSLADSSFECPRGQVAGVSNRESVIPSLRYLGDLELIEDWLTLESDAFIGRTPFDPFGPGDADNRDARNNVNITYQYGAGATLQRRLTETADVRVRYYHNEQQNAVNLLGDSSEDRGEFDLGTVRSGNRLSAGISGRYSEVEYKGNLRNNGFDTRLAAVEVRTALQLNETWQLNALGGEEWNEFTSARRDIDGTYWDAGLRWTPNERVEVNIGTGERFFGTTPRMSIRYRHKRSELSADYARTLTLPRNLRAADPGFDSPLPPDFDQLPGEPPVIGGEPTFIGNSPILNERLSVQYRFAARRTTFTIRATDSRQTRLEDLGEATFSDLGLMFSRSLSSTLSANLRLGWSERKGRGVATGQGFFGQDSETWRGTLGFSRRLGSSTTLTLGYEYIRRESDVAFNQYDENRLTLSARHQF